MISIKKCPVCQSKNLKLLHTQKSPQFTISQCEECGLAFQNPMPEAQELQKLYRDIYKGSGKAVLSSTKHAYEELDPKQEEQRLHAIEKYLRGGNLLDVGASTGFFIHEIQKHPKSSWKATGVEYAKEAVVMAKKLYGIELVHGDIFSSELPNNHYDVITMHSVLEHIPNLNETMKETWKKLKNGGMFIFNVPNLQSAEFSLFKLLNKQYPAYIEEHVYYFNPIALELLLKKHHFKLIKITSRHYSTLHWPSLRPFIGIVTFFMKLFLEYTDFGGSLKKGNVLYVYAQKID